MRLSGLFDGLLSLFHQHDHTGVVLLGLRFGTGDLNPHDFAWPWDPDVLRSFVYEVLRFITARIARLWTGKQGFATAYFSDPT